MAENEDIAEKMVKKTFATAHNEPKADLYDQYCSYRDQLMNKPFKQITQNDRQNLSELFNTIIPAEYGEKIPEDLTIEQIDEKLNQSDYERAFFTTIANMSAYAHYLVHYQRAKYIQKRKRMQDFANEKAERDRIKAESLRQLEEIHAKLASLESEEQQPTRRNKKTKITTTSELVVHENA